MNKGISQRDLAKRLDHKYSQDVLCRIETGSRRLDPIELLDICNALEVNYHDILEQITNFKEA